MKRWTWGVIKLYEKITLSNIYQRKNASLIAYADQAGWLLQEIRIYVSISLLIARAGLPNLLGSLIGLLRSGFIS